VTRLLVLAVLLVSVPAGAQTPAPAAPPAAPTAVPTPAPTPRTFTAPVGLLLNTVRPERVADFERVIGYLQDALARSGDAKDRAQAQGWCVYRAAEPGPGGSVLYVFVLDPTVPGADYGLGRILAEAYDAAKLQEIWKLYTGAVTGGGTLLNLTPVKPDTAPAASTPPVPSSPPATRP